MFLQLKRKIRKKKENYVLVFILLFVVILYAPLIVGYFEQEEWSAFARFFSLRNENVVQVLSIYFRPLITHFTPLTGLSFHWFTQIFGLYYPIFYISSITFHVLIVLLSYKLFYRLFNEKKSSFIAATFFGINAPGHQATTWVAAHFGTHGATIFGLLSLIFIFKYIDTGKKKQLVYSLTFLITSLLFKEITLGLFVFLPMIILLFSKHKTRNNKIAIFTILLIGLTYLILRIGMFVAYSRDVKGEQIITQSQSYVEIVINLIIFPIKIISQTLVPPRQQIFLANKINGGLEFVTWAIFLLISLISIIFVFKNKDKKAKKIFVFAILFVTINSFIYALSPSRLSTIPIIDSRNLYFPALGTSIIIAVMVGAIMKVKKKVGWFILAIIFTMNIFWLEKDIELLSTRGKIRREILRDIKNDYPILSDKTIFYTESDTSFYGLPENERIFPFQSGFGHTIFIYYSQNQLWPKELYSDKERFLWEITEQGYKEINGQGFGYFRDFNLLTKAVKDNNLELDSVIAYRYNSENKEIEDMTSEIRGRIKGYFATKKQILNYKLSPISSVNNLDIGFAFDNNINTFWDSGVQYMFDQNIQINLNNPSEISQININSYDNKDQNFVGYRVLTSLDNENWEEVFKSLRCPPGNNGIVNLYFKPTLTRHVKIEQIGYHQYATWVIHEIELYEAIN